MAFSLPKHSAVINSGITSSLRAYVTCTGDDKAFEASNASLVFDLPSTGMAGSAKSAKAKVVSCVGY